MSNDQAWVNASKYLIYNIKMYIETLRWLSENIIQPSGWNMVRNSMIESHLTNARVLVEFLVNKKKKDNDKFAYTYFSNTNNTHFPIDDSELREYKTYLDQKVAHLTLNPAEDFKWKSELEFYVFKYQPKIIQELTYFFDNVPEARVDSNVKQIAKRLLENPSDSKSILGLDDTPISPST